jgi:hypothetical protein
MHLAAPASARNTQIMRGDGKSNVFSDDCFTAPLFPTGKADIALMNPPFGRSMSIPVFKFLDRGLEGLKDGGHLVAIIPDGVLMDTVRSRHVARALHVGPQSYTAHVRTYGVTRNEAR